MTSKLTFTAAGLALLGGSAAPAWAYPEIDPATGARSIWRTVNADAGTPAATTAASLSQGFDYRVDAFGNGVIYVQNPQGVRTVQFQTPGGNLTGTQLFRAAYTGTFWLGAEYTGGPEPYAFVIAQLHPDCRDDVGTRCALGFAHTQAGGIANTSDRDWYAVRLVKGVRYHFTLASSLAPTYLTLRSPRGAALVKHVAPGEGSAFVDYRPTRSGTYFVAASLVDNTSGGTGYTLAAERR